MLNPSKLSFYYQLTQQLRVLEVQEIIPLPLRSQTRRLQAPVVGITRDAFHLPATGRRRRCWFTAALLPTGTKQIAQRPEFCRG